MAKPMLVTLPFVLLLLDYWPLRRLARDFSWEAIAGLARRKFPFSSWRACPARSLFWCRNGGGGGIAGCVPVAGAVGQYPAGIRGLLVQGVLAGGLASFYPHEPLRAAAVFGAVAGLAGLTFLAVWRRRSQPYLAVGWFWFLGCCADNWRVQRGAVDGGPLQLPASVACGSCGVGMRTAARPLLRPSMIGAGAAAVAICAVLTSRHAEIYRDSRTLWEATLRSIQRV